MAHGPLCTGTRSLIRSILDRRTTNQPPAAMHTDSRPAILAHAEVEVIPSENTILNRKQARCCIVRAFLSDSVSRSKSSQSLPKDRCGGPTNSAGPKCRRPFHRVNSKRLIVKTKTTFSAIMERIDPFFMMDQ